jgi:prepilin-type processing-associated H-X9-DG protein
LALEVNDEKAVKWTQPGDLAYDMDDPLVGLGNAHPGGFMAAFGDGSVRFIAQTIDEELFGFLLGMADGQRTDF